MSKLKSWQCSCGRYAARECDWPGSVPGTFCCKPVCGVCMRVVDGKEYCPFHRGDPPDVVARKEEEAAAAATAAGLEEAEKARRMFGLTGGDMKKSRGFTLIEISIVMVVIGLLTTGALKMFTGMAASARMTASNNAVRLVEQSLVVYAQQYGCLPCPANGALVSGVANAGRALDAAGAPYSGCTNNGCWPTAGVVPWLTLGLSEPEASDAWNSRLSYHVGGVSLSGDAVDSNCGSAGTTVSVERSSGLLLETITQTTPPNRSCPPQGSLQVDSASGVELTGGAGNRAVYVLISHGSDGYGGWISSGNQRGGGHAMAAQISNAGDVGPFVQDLYTGAASANYFDDIVLWRAGALAVSKCGAGLCGNPN